MRILHRRITIARPREAVFDMLTDFSQAARWRSYVTSMELLDAAPLRAGSRARVTMELSGEPHTFEMTIVALERPSLWRHHTNEPDYTGYVEYKLDADGTGTRVSMSINAKPHTWYGWFGLPLLWLSRRRSYPDHLPQLKRVLEEGA